MFEKLSRSWRQFKQARPGQRFQDARRRRRQEKASGAGSALFIALGIALALLGVVALFFPGPGILFIAMGAALIARESMKMARAMDAIELRLRRLAAHVRRRWQHTALMPRVAVVFLAAAAVGAAGVGAWLHFRPF